MIQKIMGRVTACDLDATCCHGEYVFKMDLDRRTQKMNFDPEHWSEHLFTCVFAYALFFALCFILSP